MIRYRVHVLDIDGAVGGELELDCDNDDHAIATVFGAETMFGCELWAGQRFLGLFGSPCALRTLYQPNSLI